MTRRPPNIRPNSTALANSHLREADARTCRTPHVTASGERFGPRPLVHESLGAHEARSEAEEGHSQATSMGADRGHRALGEIFHSGEESRERGGAEAHGEAKDSHSSGSLPHLCCFESILRAATTEDADTAHACFQFRSHGDSGGRTEAQSPVPVSWSALSLANGEEGWA